MSILLQEVKLFGAFLHLLLLALAENIYLSQTCLIACMLSHFSRVQFFATLWTVACQAPQSMGFPRQEYWNGLPFPSPGIFLTQGWNSGPPALQVDSFPSEPPGIHVSPYP